MYRLQGRWFRLSVETFDAIHYAGMAAYKLAILLLNPAQLLELHLSDGRPGLTGDAAWVPQDQDQLSSLRLRGKLGTAANAMRPDRPSPTPWLARASAGAAPDPATDRPAIPRS